MALLVTPSQHHARAELYYQLSQLTHAGIGLSEALQVQLKAPPARSMREPIRRILGALQEGSTFGEAIQRATGLIPSFDQALLDAGERSGRLPASFRLLADHYQEQFQLGRQVLSDLAYPVGLFHAAIFLGPLPQLVLSGEFAPYLTKVGLVLAPIYLVALVLLYAGQAKHGETWRAAIESVTRVLPLIGNARRNLALARLSTALEALLNAGVPIVAAWELAAAASGSPRLKRTVNRWRSRVDAGETPAQLVAESDYFPPVFASLYNTGEISGSLDDSLKHLGALHRDAGTRQIRTVCRLIPRTIYLGILLFVAYKIVSFYAGYFKAIGDVIPQ